MSSYKTYTVYGILNVIFGGNSGTIVATTDEMEKDTTVHSGTYDLHSLSARLLTSNVSTITLGVTSKIGTDSNRINIRTGCTLTLTIEYEYNHKTVRYYDGDAWTECVPHYYDGSVWKQCDPYYYNGTGWKECNGS